MRRPIIMLALVVTSIVLSACADVSAPKRDDPTDPPCLNGYQTSSGKWVCP